MSTGLDDTSTSRRRRQPLWPWLLMPLAALAIYLGLRNARDDHPPVPARSTPAQSTDLPAAPAEPQR
jgi:hypothetical protein